MKVKIDMRLLKEMDKDTGIDKLIGKRLEQGVKVPC